MIYIICGAIVTMTGYGIWLSFGPPSKELTDSFDEHDHD